MAAGLLLALLAGGSLSGCPPGPPPVLRLVPPTTGEEVPPALHRFLPRLTGDFWQGATAIELQRRHPCLAVSGGGRFSSAEAAGEADLLLSGSFEVGPGRPVAARRLTFHPRRDERVTVRARGLLVYTFELRDAASGELYGSSRYTLAWVDPPRDDERLLADPSEAAVDNLFYGEWSPDLFEGRLPDPGLGGAAARLRVRRTPVAASVEPLPPDAGGPIRLVGIRDAGGEPLADGTPLLVREFRAGGEAQEVVLAVEGGAITLPSRQSTCAGGALERHIEVSRPLSGAGVPHPRAEAGRPARGGNDSERRAAARASAGGEGNPGRRVEVGGPAGEDGALTRRAEVRPAVASDSATRRRDGSARPVDGDGRPLELRLPLADCLPRRAEQRVRLVSRREGGGTTEQEALFVFALGSESRSEPAGRGRAFEHIAVTQAWLLPVRFTLREPLADAPGCERRLSGWPGPLRPEQDGSGATLTLLRSRRSEEIVELRLPAWSAVVRWSGGDTCDPAAPRSSTASLLPSLPPGALGRGCSKPDSIGADGVAGGCRWQGAAAGGSREGSVAWSVRLAPAGVRAGDSTNGADRP